MIKQIITVNRKRYATGLFWQPVGVGNTAQNYAKQLAKNKKYTLFVGYKSMVGLTDNRDGARSGMGVAAVEIVNALSELISFLGVFKVDNSYYLIAVRNGVIIRDILLDNADTARKLFSELVGIPDWGALFAPSAWGIPKSQEKYLADLMAKNTGIKLRQISITKSIMPSLILAALFIVFGLYVLKNPVSVENTKTSNISQENIDKYKQQIELNKQQAQDVKPIIKNEFVYPYDVLPDVAARADLCYRAIAFVMQPIMGWNQTYAKCDGEFVSATFSRDFGSLNDFYNIGGELMPGAIVQQMSEDEIIVRVKLPELKTGSSLDERDQSSVMRDVATIFQQANIKAEIEGVTDTIMNNDTEERLYITEISVSSKLTPMEFMQAFNGFNGVYMTSVVWRANTRIWNYEIIIYSK